MDAAQKPQSSTVVVCLVLLDEEGKRIDGSDLIRVSVQATSAFHDDETFARELAPIIETALDKASLRTDRPRAAFDIVDLDFRSETRLHWLVDLYQGEDRDLRPASVVGSNVRIALCRAALRFMREDLGQGASLSEVAVRAGELLAEDRFLGPIPAVLAEHKTRKLIAEIVAHDPTGNDVVEELVQLVNDPVVGRRGDPKDDGDILVTFESDDIAVTGSTIAIVRRPTFDLVTGGIATSSPKEGGLYGILLDCAKAVASRYVQEENFAKDSDYLDRMDEVVESLSLVGLAKVGELRTVITTGLFHGNAEDGVFEDLEMQAVDEEDAILQATLRMCGMERPSGETGLELVGDSFGAHRITVEPVPYEITTAREILCRLALEDPAILPDRIASIARIHAAAISAFYDEMDRASATTTHLNDDTQNEPVSRL